MAAFGASFESASSIEGRRENKRKSRQEAVEKVRQDKSLKYKLQIVIRVLAIGQVIVG